MFVDPGFRYLSRPEIDDEAVGVRRRAGEGQVNRPVVAVDQRANARRGSAADGRGNIAVGFSTSEHDKKRVGSAEFAGRKRRP